MDFLEFNSKENTMSDGIQKYSPKESGNLSIGQMGFNRITFADGLQEGTWIALMAYGGVDAIVTFTADAGDTAETLLIKPGEVFPGCFTSLNVSGGSVIAYRG